MSVDMFFQGFVRGDGAEGGGSRAKDLLAPFVVNVEPEHDFARIAVGDGEADVFHGEDRLMANHVSGVGPWELFFDIARATGWVVMPVGSPVCLTSEEQRGHLPDVLQEDARVIVSGVDLRKVVIGS